MKIRNINGTSDNQCKCGTWLKHWEKYSGQELPSYCPVRDCLSTDLVGAHVQKVNGDEWYIAILCRGHNQSKGELEIGDYHDLALASQVETCNK